MKIDRSLTTHLAEILVAIAARAQQSAAKKAAALLSQSVQTSSGFHVEIPYITSTAEVTTTPRILVGILRGNINPIRRSGVRAKGDWNS